jgi:hypothetical protein
MIRGRYKWSHLIYKLRCFRPNKRNFVKLPDSQIGKNEYSYAQSDQKTGQQGRFFLQLSCG